MKRVMQPVSVRTRRNRPYLIRIDQRVTMDVREVLDYWVVRSRWWMPGAEEERIYFHVVTNQGTMELYRRGSDWVLTRRFD